MQDQVRRIAGVVARCAAIVLLGVAIQTAGCAMGGTPRAPEAQPRAILRRPPETSFYRMTVSRLDSTGAAVGRGVTTFKLSAADSSEEVTLLEASTFEAPQRQGAPIVLDPGCRAAFGAGADTLGRFRVDAARKVIEGDRIPACVPEALFGAVTDILTFLQVQSEGFGIDHLHQLGDRYEFAGFHVNWRRPPATLDARLSAPSGELVFAREDSAGAHLEWKPKPMDVAIVRAAPTGGTMLLAGLETFALEVIVDPRSGRLLSGRALTDDLRLSLWTHFAGQQAPLPTSRPSTPGIPVHFARTLQLERLR